MPGFAPPTVILQDGTLDDASACCTLLTPPRIGIESNGSSKNCLAVAAHALQDIALFPEVEACLATAVDNASSESEQATHMLMASSISFALLARFLPKREKRQDEISEMDANRRGLERALDFSDPHEGRAREGSRGPFLPPLPSERRLVCN